MKHKAIASKFSKNKRLIVYTAVNGEQWISNGVAVYSLRGMPPMNPETVLRIFDIPPDKHNDWLCEESDLPSVIDFSQTVGHEVDVEPESIKIEFPDKKYWLFPYQRQIFAIDEGYIKPLLDEEDYLTFHLRKDDHGFTFLAAKIGLELMAIIPPEFLHRNEVFMKSIKYTANLFEEMAEDNDFYTSEGYISTSNNAATYSVEDESAADGYEQNSL